MKPLALDLCCGKGGWSIGLLKAGWDVIGVDIEDWKSPCTFFLQEDARNIWSILDGVNTVAGSRKVSLVVASPPCQEFSYSSFPFKKAREKFTKDNPPDRTIWEACVRIAKELKAPLILENVQGARKWMGPSSWHYGSFYFWGEMPALIPIGRPRKGFQQADKTSRGKRGPLNGQRATEWRGNVQAKDNRFAPSRDEERSEISSSRFPGECERLVATYKRLKNGTAMSGRGSSKVGHHKSNARKEWSAKAAMIPEEVSTWIGQCFYPRDLK